MTESMFDEKGLRASGETDPEKTRRQDDSADVEGHLRAMEPEEAGEAGRRAQRGDENEEPDVEGHRVAAFEAKEPGEAGRMRLNEDEDDGEGEGLRPR